MPKTSLLTRHRNLFLIALLAATLAVSSEMNRQRIASSHPTVTLPVSAPATDLSAVSVWADERDADYQRDLAALRALTEQESLDSRTREDAAARLTELIASHQAQQALDKALSQSMLAPCASIVTASSVTIVTEQTTVPDEAAALALTLAAVHAGASPSDVRIITSK